MAGIKRDNSDKWFSDVVRIRAKWCCQHCGKSYGGRSSGLHCAHIYGRSNKATRWSLDNAVSLCYACHQHYGANPVAFTDWLTGFLGSGHMDILVEKKNAIMKTNEALRKQIAEHYREEYKKCESDEDYIPVSWN